MDMRSGVFDEIRILPTMPDNLPYARTSLNEGDGMKETILFMPGLLCTERLWSSQLAYFSDDYDCVVADMTKDDTLSGIVERALANMPERFSVAGLSMGGYAAFEVMRQAADRVTRLALLDTSARADTPERIERRKGLIARVENGEFKDVTEEHFPTFVHPDRLSEESIMADFRASAAEVGAAAYIQQNRVIMARPDSLPLLPSIDCPTLVLCGAEDALTVPELHDEMAAAIPGAALVKIPHCGHLSPLERPDDVNAALRDWLTRS